MAEHLIIKGETKEELYATLLPQLKSLIEGENDIIANMANISACIMDTFRFWWVGFYRVIDGTLYWVLSRDRWPAPASNGARVFAERLGIKRRPSW